MTSDAKIGLLLGLVFIFVIAFIINGLPNFGDHAKAEATPMMNTQTDQFGIADSARNAQEQLDWEALLEEEGEDLVAVPEAEPAVATAETTSATTTGAETGEVRRVYTLDDLVGGVSGKFQAVVKNLIETTPTEEPATATVPAAVIETGTAEPEPVEVASRQRPAPKPAATPAPRRATTGSKIYVVEEGDVLATVAKKAYGPEEGNRLVNIERIFKANQDTMKTADEIFVGQKLVIPSLPASTAGQKDDALSSAIFEKVQQIGKREVAEVKAGSSKAEGRVYTVQDGDSLWKIASSQLGSGARWEEIVKLNQSTLKSKEATLVIGMQLRLPAK